uniref:Rhodanese domain-containing protein n=1 Tax=Trypanosoma congolense (strain IL3000) TaxID=1068625 RepID=G0V2L7_TRYCI|nr:hypothetical protein, unlikely [Trypanosoma congolense IL3000]
MFSFSRMVLNTVTAQQVAAIVQEKLRGSGAVANTIIVDVRSTAEVSLSGIIPSAVNIPLKALPVALSDEVDDEEFRQAFGHPKPLKKTSHMIFYCEKGVRSAFAVEMAESLGYENVSNFVGSFVEWRELHNGSPFVGGSGKDE